MEPVRLGVIGCGVMGNSHLTNAMALPEHYKVVAVADLIRERAAAAKEKYGAARTYRHGNSLIDKDPEVEAVVLAFPAHARAAMAVRAFSRGRHVLTEKPVAINAGQVRRMIAARGTLVGACCQSRYRFNEHTGLAAKLIEGGAIGDIRLVRARELRPAGGPPKNPPPTWRLRTIENGGGILLNWGCYDLDYVLTLTGWKLKPQWALARAWTIPPMIASHITPDSDAETHFAAIITCEGGAAITFERGEYMACSADDAWQIIGTKGALRLKMTPGKDKTVIHDELTPDRGVVSKEIWRGEEGWGIGPALGRSFAEAVRGLHPPQASLEDALLVQEISDAIYESSRRGKAVKVGR